MIFKEVPYHEDASALFGDGVHAFTFGSGKSHWFLYEDVLAGTQKIHGHRMVLVVGKNQ